MSGTGVVLEDSDCELVLVVAVSVTDDNDLMEGVVVRDAGAGDEFLKGVSIDFSVDDKL